jgi:succinoglycan biosynthesis transport protein ExoP
VSQDRTETLNLHRAWGALVRNRWLAAAVLGLCLGLAVLATWRAAPVYVSEATLQIDDEGSSAMLLKELSPLAGMDRGRIETDMVVMRSRTLAERVADSLGLQVMPVRPETPREEIFSRVHGSDARIHGTFTLVRGPGDSYTLDSEDAVGVRRGPQRLTAGQPFRLGSIELTVARGAAEREEFRVASLRNAVRGMQHDLEVARPNRDAKVVHVRFRNSDPGVVAGVPNALTRAFMAYTATGSKAESRSTVDFLREQVANYEEQLRGAETELRGFRESSQVVNLEAEGTEQVKRMATLQAERDAVVTERDGIAQQLSRLAASGGGVDQYRQLASFPTFLQNRAVQDILQALTGLEGERVALLQRRTEENVDVRSIDERIGVLEQQLLQMARGYLQSLDTQLASLNANLGRFGTQLETLPAREIQFARLLRQENLLEEIYTLLQTRLKEAEIQLAVEPTDVRVIDSSVRPDRPVAPSPLLNLMLGGVLGVLAAGVAVFLRESLNTRIRSEADVSQATHGLPILGTIPRIRPSATATNGNGNGKKHGRITAVRPEDVLESRLVMRRDPRSPVAEAYRSLRTNLTFASSDRAPRVVVLTSAMPGDGKSTSASNLALTLALQGNRVLLVDADLRRGVLHQIFGTPQEPGLTHVVHLGTPIEEAIRTLPVGDGGETLDFLPSGVFPPNPAEMLGSPAMHALMDKLRERYDMVVLDCPPVNAVTDAAVLGTQADVALLVARAGVTDRRALHHALAQLRHLGVRVGGVVLNDAPTGTVGYHAYGYGYGGQ